MSDIGLDFKRIKPEFYSLVDGSVICIDETQKDGKANLTVSYRLDQDKTFIKLLQEHTDWLAYTENKKCADGIIIELDTLDKAHCRLYIFELKRTVDAEKWSIIKKQFRGATLRALAFLSTLGIKEISDISYYTCFVNSTPIEHSVAAIKAKKMIKKSSIAARKMLVGMNRKEEELLEWNEEDIKIFEEIYLHRKITMTISGDTAIGTYQLDG